MNGSLSPVPVGVTTNLKMGILSEEGGHLYGPAGCPTQGCVHASRPGQNVCRDSHSTEWRVALSLWSDFVPLNREDLGVRVLQRSLVAKSTTQPNLSCTWQGLGRMSALTSLGGLQ